MKGVATFPLDIVYTTGTSILMWLGGKKSIFFFFWCEFLCSTLSTGIRSFFQPHHFFLVLKNNKKHNVTHSEEPFNHTLMSLTLRSKCINAPTFFPRFFSPFVSLVKKGEKGDSAYVVL